MKALSLWQPWASLVMSGAKSIETRSWAPPDSLIGQFLAIHAAKKSPIAAVRDIDIGDLGDMCVGLWAGRQWRQSRPAEAHAGWESVEASMQNLPVGAMLGIVKVNWACQVMGRVGDHAVGVSDGMLVDIDPFGDFSVGRWLWGLSIVKIFAEPIPARGRQRLFEWNPEGVAQNA